MRSWVAFRAICPHASLAYLWKKPKPKPKPRPKACVPVSIENPAPPPFVKAPSFFPFSFLSLFFFPPFLLGESDRNADALLSTALESAEKKSLPYVRLFQIGEDLGSGFFLFSFFSGITLLFHVHVRAVPMGIEHATWYSPTPPRLPNSFTSKGRMHVDKISIRANEGNE